MRQLLFISFIALTLVLGEGCKKEEIPTFVYYDWFGYNSERYLIQKNGNFGFIDREGIIVIEPVFKYPAYFFNGVAIINGPWNDSVINVNGETILKPSGYSIIQFSKEGISPVRKKDEGEGYIDLQGNFVVPLIYDQALPLYEGYGRVQKNSVYGYVNSEGVEHIECQFIKAGHFNNGMSVVGNGDKYGYINKEGELVIAYQYHEGLMFTENLAGVSNGQKYGFIDKTGSLVIDYKFDLVFSFTEGLALVKSEGLYGYINHQGEWVIEPMYENGWFFSEELAYVKVDKLWGYINKEGEYIIEPQFTSAHSFINGLALVTFENGSRAYINKEGRIVCIYGDDYKKKSAVEQNGSSGDLNNELLEYIFKYQSEVNHTK